MADTPIDSYRPLPVVLEHVGRVYALADELLSGLEGCDWWVVLSRDGLGSGREDVTLRASYLDQRWRIVWTFAHITNMRGFPEGADRDARDKIRQMKARMLTGDVIRFAESADG